jgi:hypothetical protein
MESIGNRQYGLSIDGDIIYTIPIAEATGEIAERFYEGFKQDVTVLDVTDKLPLGIGWELEGNSFVDNSSNGSTIDSATPDQKFYAFIANNKIFGIIRPALSEEQKDMLAAAFSTGGVKGLDVTNL